MLYCLLTNIARGASSELLHLLFPLLTSYFHALLKSLTPAPDIMRLSSKASVFYHPHWQYIFRTLEFLLLLNLISGSRIYEAWAGSKVCNSVGSCPKFFFLEGWGGGCQLSVCQTKCQATWDFQALMEQWFLRPLKSACKWGAGWQP